MGYWPRKRQTDEQYRKRKTRGGIHIFRNLNYDRDGLQFAWERKILQ